MSEEKGRGLFEPKTGLKPEERQLVVSLRLAYMALDEETSYQSIKDGFTPEVNRKLLGSEDLSFQEKQALSFILKRVIKQLEEESGEEKIPFEEQFLALAKAVKAYKKIKRGELTGNLFEIATGEGKSSVTIPALCFYLSLFEEQVHLHTANQYLAERDFERLKKIGERLGLGVGYLENPFDLTPLSAENQIVVGQWQSFIHGFENYFIAQLQRGKNDTQTPESATILPNSPIPANPFLILDEVDQLVYDELATPAVISREIKTDDFLTEFSKKIEQEINTINQRNQRESYSINNQDYQPLADFTKGKENWSDFLQFLVGYGQNVVEAWEKDNKFQRLRDREKQEKLEERLGFLLLADALLSNQEKEQDEKTKLKTVERINKEIDRNNILLWWEIDGDFLSSLSVALTTKKGVDYEVIQGEIKPLSKTSGYAEMGKEFDHWLQIFLRLKEGLPLPEKLQENIDELPVFSFYYKRPILGFSGSIGPISRRLREIYGFETETISAHFKTQREDEGFVFVRDWAEQKKKLADFLSRVLGKNIIVVVDTQEQADEIVEFLNEIYPQLDVGSLTPKNQYLDQAAYSFISQYREEGRVLVVSKMIGRGVDLKPDNLVKEKGILLISLTPLGVERAYDQLVGRIGRRGEKGRTVFIVSGDSEDLVGCFGRLRKLLDMGVVKKMWKKNEDRAIAFQKEIAVFNDPLMRLRRLLVSGLFTRPPVNVSQLDKLLDKIVDVIFPPERDKSGQVISEIPRQYRWPLEKIWNQPEFLQFLSQNWISIIDALKLEYFIESNKTDVTLPIELRWPVRAYEKIKEWYGKWYKKHQITTQSPPPDSR